jgi:hypothetical protein
MILFAGEARSLIHNTSFSSLLGSFLSYEENEALQIWSQTLHQDVASHRVINMSGFSIGTVKLVSLKNFSSGK